MPRLSLPAVSLLLFLPAPLLAATYTVGPSGRQYTQLSQVFSNNNLEPGDIVLVDGNASYSGNIVVGSDDGGSASSPVVIRWRRGPGESRPRLQGGDHTIKFERSNHVVFEGFEVRGGSRSCIFSEAHDVTVRDAVITNCPAHGILGADQNSGSFTLEYSEIANSGSGTTKHSIYMQSDEVTWPDTVFRMRHNYVHSATGGVLVRVRHQRSEIHYNWIEGSVYGEVELIGPDCETQKPGWNANLRREDADVVGNVIVHTSSWRNAIRMGGDLNGRSQGRVRLVNNTILFTNAGQANAVMVQLGAESLEMHNNVIYQSVPGSAPAIVRENPAGSVDTPFCGPQGREPWSSGRKVFGSNNWVQNSAVLVPPEFTGTRQGSNPMFANIGAYLLRPAAGSALIDGGSSAPPSPAGFPFPSPLLLPVSDPPLRAKMALDGQRPRIAGGTAIDIGALEDEEGGGVVPLVLRHGSRPLLPPALTGASGMQVSAAGSGPTAAALPAAGSGEAASPAAQQRGSGDGVSTTAASATDDIAIDIGKQRRAYWVSRWWRFTAWVDGLLR